MAIELMQFLNRYRISATFVFFVALCFIVVYTTTSISLSQFVNVMNIAAFRVGNIVELTVKSHPWEHNLTVISQLMKVEGIDCPAIFNGSEVEIKQAKKIGINMTSIYTDKMFQFLTTDCDYFKKFRGYITSSLTKEEEEFPIAFSIMVYKDIEMVDRLLRAIYRPQNLYCIHVDQKASKEFHLAISNIAKCFYNVFLTSRRISVVWGQFTVLEPELLCMEELWRYPKWKYFINLTGQEFPLKTNFEIVKILTAYNGAVDVATTYKLANQDRWKNTKPPHKLNPVKGSVHIVVNREFIDFILHNKTATDLLKWTNTTHIPDETFFAILNANPKLGIKGTYKGDPELTETRPFLARYKNWGSLPCAGKKVRGICILTTGDLPLLSESSAMYANKFFLDEDRVVIGCLEEKLINDTISETLGTKTFNTSYYSNLDFVRNQVT